MKDLLLDQIVEKLGPEPVPYYSLMPKRVRNILLVSSLYDSFTFEEDGSFTELLFSEYLDLNLRYAPRIHRVSTAKNALEQIKSSHFDLVISMLRVGEMDLAEFGEEIRKINADIPVILLAYSARELLLLESAGDLLGIDRIFAWQGDVRLFLAMVKYCEDRFNAWHDSQVAGVKSIILIEDSIRFYSSYLPMLYTEIMEQTQILMSEGVNQIQKLMRMRARPKILLASTYEEAEQLYDKFRENVLGIISDAGFRKNGEVDPEAGLKLARKIKDQDPDCPILIQSSEEQNRELAESLGAAFVNKYSPTLLQDVREFMRGYLGFGDFVFRTSEGKVEAGVTDLRSMTEALKKISEESLLYHARRNDFSTWLMARTEFDLAKALRPQKVEDFDSVSELRKYLLSSIRLWRERSRAGQVEEFSREFFDVDTGFVKIGSGSLGGKGRGLAFVNSLLNSYAVEERFPDVQIFVPPTAVLATDVFDRFMEAPALRNLIFNSEKNEIKPGSKYNDMVMRAFLAADIPGDVVSALKTFLEKVHYPLAVRSSSLLEDSPSQPFAGVYRTYMLPNDEKDLEVRLEKLCEAVKLVYASTYYSEARSYIDSSPNRLEEEKMAVVVQQVVGHQHSLYFYPDIAGIARSYDFYPLSGSRAEDGVASVALGLGGTVVGGGKCVRFSPANPGRLYQFSSLKDYLENSQREFLALRIGTGGTNKQTSSSEDINLENLDIEVAQEHGTLTAVGSVYSSENDMIIEGTNRPGIKLVSMAGVLAGNYFAFAEVLNFLLKVGVTSFSCHVEIEYAVNLASFSEKKPSEFAFLQIRPMPFGSGPKISIGKVDPGEVICLSHSVLGYGSFSGIQDLVYVCPETFDRSITEEIALELEKINWKLLHDGYPYILIGQGRWGSADNLLGIPVSWPQISGARCIIETPVSDMDIEPSQGTHFFQNVTSLGIGYFTISKSRKNDLVDWQWLDKQKAEDASDHVRHIRFEKPLEIIIDRRSEKGVIMKPGYSAVKSSN